MRQPRLRTVLIGAGAALALVTGGTAAYAAVTAGPIDSSGAIHGCYYRATGGLHKLVLRNVGRRCPRGTTAIKWNQKGPRGIVTGYAASGGSVSLTSSLTTVDTLNLPSGDFLLNAKAVVFGSLTGDDDYACYLVDGSGTAVDESYGKLSPGSSGADQGTLALTGPTTAGGTIQLECADALGIATATDSVITAVPLGSVSGATSHLQHPQRLRGTAVVPQRG
jgi:hypothetical protein